MSKTQLRQVLSALVRMRAFRADNSHTPVDVLAEVQTVDPSYTLPLLTTVLNAGSRRGLFSSHGKFDTGFTFSYNQDMVARNFANKEFVSPGLWPTEAFSVVKCSGAKSSGQSAGGILDGTGYGCTYTPDIPI